MHGLTIRWSLADAPDGVLDSLRDFIAGTSFVTFESLHGLHMKIWRAVDGQWFEGSYVFATAGAREAFQTGFEEIVAETAGTTIIGSLPLLVEPCTIVAVAEGPAGFRSAPRFEA